MTTPTAATIGKPVRIRGREGPWDGVRGSLAASGAALLYARMADWRPDRASAARLRAMLGSDWPRYLDLTHADVRQRFASSRVLLKFTAAAALGVTPEDIELRYSPSGRPVLRGFDGIDISLSHTADLLLVGISTTGVIGVDAERADRTLWSSGVSKHLCTPAEIAQVEALDEPARDPFLLRLWTLKESYSKAIGQGMMFPFTEFGFEGANTTSTEQRISVVGPDGSRGTGREWRFATHLVDERFVVSVAIGDHGFSTLDTRAATTLDEQLLDAVLDAMGTDDEDDDDAGWGGDDDW